MTEISTYTIESSLPEPKRYTARSKGGVITNLKRRDILKAEDLNEDRTINIESLSKNEFFQNGKNEEMLRLLTGHSVGKKSKLWQEAAPLFAKDVQEATLKQTPNEVIADERGSGRWDEAATDAISSEEASEGEVDDLEDSSDSVTPILTGSRRRSARLGFRGRALLLAATLTLAIAPVFSASAAGNGTPEPNRYPGNSVSPVPTSAATATSTSMPSVTPTMTPTKAATSTATATPTRTPDMATATATTTATSTETAQATTTATPGAECRKTDINGHFDFTGPNHRTGKHIVAHIENNSPRADCPNQEVDLHEFTSPLDPEAAGWLESQSNVFNHRYGIPFGAKDFQIVIDLDSNGKCVAWQVDLTRTDSTNPHDYNGENMIDFSLVDKSKDDCVIPTSTTTPTTIASPTLTFTSTTTATTIPTATFTATVVPTETSTPVVSVTNTPQPSSGGGNGNGERPKTPTSIPERPTKLCDVTVESDAQFVQLFPASRFGFSEWNSQTIQEATTTLTDSKKDANGNIIEEGTRDKLILEHNTACQVQLPAAATPSPTPAAPIPVPPAQVETTPSAPEATPEASKEKVCTQNGDVELTREQLVSALADHNLSIDDYGDDDSKYEKAAQALGEVLCPVPEAPPVVQVPPSVQAPSQPSEGQISDNLTTTETDNGSIFNAFGAPILEDEYTVQSGDTVWAISGRAYGNADVKAIQALNHLKNPGMIFPGQVLRIRS